jgi:hypothetical protein
MEHTLRSSSLLRVEVSRDVISQSGLKTGGGVAWMVHVASSRRLHRVEAEDGWVDTTDCVGYFYPNFIIFYVLVAKSILVFWLLL